MKKIITFSFVLFSIVASATSFKYVWKANSGIWNSTNSGNWQPAGIPNAMDTVVFDGSSFNGPNQVVTIAGSVQCGHIIFENLKYPGTKIQSSPNDSLTVTERMELSPDLVVDFKGTLIFSTFSPTPGKINTYGKPIGNLVVFKSPYGKYEVKGTFYTLPTGFTILNEGTLEMMGNSKYYTPKFHVASGGYPSGLNMYDYSELICESEFLVNTASFNVNMYGAAIIRMQNKANNFIFKGNGKTYGDLSVNTILTMQDANTFNRISMQPGASLILPAQQTVYVNSIVGDGAPNDSIRIHTDVTGLNAFIEDNNGNSNCLYNAVITDVYAGSTASFNCAGCNTSAVSFGWANQPCVALTGSISVTDSSVNCYGGTNGAFVSMSGSGLTSELTYIWAGADPYAGPYQSTSTNLKAGTFNIGFTAGGKDTIFQTITITQPDSFRVDYKYKDISCNGAGDGVVWAELTGGTKPYIFSGYSWSISPTPPTTDVMLDTLFYVTAGSYAVSHWVYDKNYCPTYITGDTFTLKEPAVLTPNSNSKWTDCFVAANGEAYYLASGGTTPYSYTWNNGAYPDNDTLTGLVQGAYALKLTDASGCTLQDTVWVNALYGCPSITGNVTYQLNAISGVNVMLLGFDSLATMQVIKDTTTDVNGYYEFDTIPFGKYIVLIEPPLGVAGLENALATYYDTLGGTNEWILAQIFNIKDCQDSFNGINVDIIEVPQPDSVQTSSVSGHIYEGPGFTEFQRTITSPKIDKLFGKSISGVDISLKKKPSGQLTSVTTTDSAGFYQFEFIPTGAYDLYVDYPGLPMDSTYNFSISVGDTLTNLDFFIDSNYIYIDPLTTVRYQSAVVVKTDVMAYPNPFNNSLNMVIELAQSSQVKIEMLNMLGQSVYTIEPTYMEKGVYRYIMDAKANELNNGVYFVKFTLNNEVRTLRVIRNQ